MFNDGYMSMIETISPVTVAVFLAMVGACVGSFITLITYRLPLGLDVITTRSRCPKCQKPLGVRDLFPVLSWVAMRGSSRCCQQKIGIRYPLTELVCALCAVLPIIIYGATISALLLVGLLWAVVAIFITDLEHQIILDEVQIFTWVLGCLYALMQGKAPEDSIVLTIAGIGIGLGLKYGFLYFVGKDGLGLGDVKFLGAAGVWLPAWQAFVPFMFFAGVLGIMSAWIWRKAGHGERFPFGPALALSLLLCVFYPTAARSFFTLFGLLDTPPVF